MNGQPPNRLGSTSPDEKLSNVYDALINENQIWDDIEVDQATRDRATGIVRDALTEALGPVQASAFTPEKQAQQAPAPSEGTQLISKSSKWRKFGLYPAVALMATLLAITVDITVWGTFGIGFLLELPIAALVGTATILMQEKLYGDSRNIAIVKGLIVTVLTMLPIPLAPFIFIPVGILGLLHHKPVAMERLRRKQMSEERETTKTNLK